ncbi:ROK family protein [Arthrobacter flavus]|uniref:ROK family protein n=1 Tax=Arthrobacter flavus TaxID=95172 RepID=A0ABW4QAT8_9MICC
MTANDGVYERLLSDVRSKNVVACLQEIRSTNAVTLTALSKATGLSRPTVESVVTELIHQGLVGELPSGQGATHAAGRPARRFAFLADSRRIMSVDVGIHRMRAMLANLAGTVTDELVWDVPDDADDLERFDFFADLTRSLLGVAGVAAQGVSNVTVAVPGIVDLTGNMLLSDALPQWVGVDLASQFRQRMSGTLVVENDINMAALAEHAIGAARLASDVTYIQVGHRTNSALILGGQLRRGRHFATGEVGGLPSSGWNQFGVDLNALPPHDSAAHRFERAKIGDPEATVWVRDFARSLAPGVSSLMLAVDPDVVIIGGGVSGAGDLLLDPLREALAEIIPAHMQPHILASTIGVSGVAVGGIVRGLDEASHKLYAGGATTTPRIDLAGLKEHTTRRNQ